MKFSPQSRVWVYQSNRVLNEVEVNSIQQELDAFMEKWLAHGNPLSAKAEILYNTFIVIIVDETQFPATGCSIDSSVKMLKELEVSYKIDLFNRFNMAYKQDNEIVIVSKEDFETLVNIEKVNTETIVFNNMIQNYEEFKTKWEVPFKDSWHSHIFGHLIK